MEQMAPTVHREQQVVPAETASLAETERAQRLSVIIRSIREIRRRQLAEKAGMAATVVIQFRQHSSLDLEVKEETEGTP
jgi:hypothetical protein